ncbi:uncharacterized protein BXZ73DRAFT_76502 [Epithele typhae]|uniref:uncharacterized protein n=1 Tax=Epithele typhae TaxID=378194 RepID=UPI00200844F8|nr:uncharacterized protein BXZ73DRAFT_76502 [Epithele typhae]KAH9937874.1 hypothetical protein BXZ73DRAFT_76502 [Epithele typhae]
MASSKRAREKENENPNPAKRNKFMDCFSTVKDQQRTAIATAQGSACAVPPPPPVNHDIALHETSAKPVQHKPTTHLKTSAPEPFWFPKKRPDIPWMWWAERPKILERKELTLPSFLSSPLSGNPRYLLKPAFFPKTARRQPQKTEAVKRLYLRRGVLRREEARWKSIHRPGTSNYDDSEFKAHIRHTSGETCMPDYVPLNPGTPPLRRLAVLGTSSPYQYTVEDSPGSMLSGRDLLGGRKSDITIARHLVLDPIDEPIREILDLFYVAQVVPRIAQESACRCAWLFPRRCRAYRAGGQSAHALHCPAAIAQGTWQLFPAADAKNLWEAHAHQAWELTWERKWMRDMKRASSGVLELQRVKRTSFRCSAYPKPVDIMKWDDPKALFPYGCWAALEVGERAQEKKRGLRVWLSSSEDRSRDQSTGHDPKRAEAPPLLTTPISLTTPTHTPVFALTTLFSPMKYQPTCTPNKRRRQKENEEPQRQAKRIKLGSSSCRPSERIPSCLSRMIIGRVPIVRPEPAHKWWEDYLKSTATPCAKEPRRPSPAPSSPLSGRPSYLLGPNSPPTNPAASWGFKDSGRKSLKRPERIREYNTLYRSVVNREFYRRNPGATEIYRFDARNFIRSVRKNTSGEAGIDLLPAQAGTPARRTISPMPALHLRPPRYLYLNHVDFLYIREAKRSAATTRAVALDDADISMEPQDVGVFGELQSARGSERTERVVSRTFQELAEEYWLTHANKAWSELVRRKKCGFEMQPQARSSDMVVTRQEELNSWPNPHRLERYGSRKALRIASCSGAGARRTTM